MSNSPRCMYESDLQIFLNIESKTVLGELCDSYHGAALTTTIEAWKMK